MQLTLTATSEDRGARIDAWLAAHVEGLTRSAAAKLLESGGVAVNGASAAKNYRLTGGETVEVTRPEAEEIAVEPQDIPLDVVYEDQDVIVVNKPVGLVVHPAPGHPDGTLVNALLHHCGDSLSGISGEKRPGIVHRIDRDTSGLIIAAKNDAAHLALSAQLHRHHRHTGEELGDIQEPFMPHQLVFHAVYLRSLMATVYRHRACLSNRTQQESAPPEGSALLLFVYEEWKENR